jgi:hypothetical protein
VRSRRRPVKRPAQASGVAGLSRGKRRAGGSRRSRNGAAVPTAMPRAARRSGENVAEIGGTRSASRVGDTAESSSCAPPHASARTMRDGAGGPGTPVRTKHEGEKVPRAKARPREPFTRLGGAGLGSRVRPEVARCATAGRRRRTQLRAVLPRGRPRGDRGIRGTPAGRRPEKNTLRDVRSARRSEPLRREATAPHRVGKMR